MYPLTLGANVGTTITAILASLVADTVDALQVALAHLFFNISGILLFYPIPFMRAIPLDLARKLGSTTRVWRGFPIVYIAIMFFIIPLGILGISTIFEQQTAGFTVLGSLLVILIALIIGRWVFIWNYRDGRESCVDCLTRRQRKSVAIHGLADNMELVMARLTALSDHTGLPEDDDGTESPYQDDDDGQSGQY
jgi:sodium-dependent phosphate cotransporter